MSSFKWILILWDATALFVVIFAQGFLTSNTLRQVLWSFLRSMVFLGIFVCVAWFIERMVAHDPSASTTPDHGLTQYGGIASLFIGVGGAFVVVGLINSPLKDVANVIGLASIGLGGVMIAYKETALAANLTLPFFLAICGLTLAVLLPGAVLIAFNIWRKEQQRRD